MASVNVNALTDPSAPSLCPPLAQISRNLQRLLQHLYADTNSSPAPRATQITVPQTHGTKTVKQPEFTSERINTNANLGISRAEHPSRRRWTQSHSGARLYSRIRVLHPPPPPTVPSPATVNSGDNKVIPVTVNRDNRLGSRRRRRRPPSPPPPSSVPETASRSHRRLAPSCRLAFTAARQKRLIGAITRLARVAARSLARLPKRVAKRRWGPLLPCGVVPVLARQAGSS